MFKYKSLNPFNLLRNKVDSSDVSRIKSAIKSIATNATSGNAFKSFIKGK